MFACLCTVLPLAGWNEAPSSDANSQKTEWKPDPRLQEHIRQTVLGFLSMRLDDDYVEFVRRMLKLEKTVPANKQELLVEQLAYFFAHAQTMEESAGVRHILQHMRHLSFYSSRHLIDVIVPHLDETDGRVRDRLFQLLFMNSAAYSLPIYSEFDSYLRARKAEPPLPLFEIMYQGSPGDALMTMLRVYAEDGQTVRPETVKLLKWAEHVVSDVLWKQQHGFLKPNEVEPAAVEELEKLSKRPEWWVRLYVAEILSNDPEFQTPQMVKRLQDDNHPLVRKAITRQKQ